MHAHTHAPWLDWHIMCVVRVVQQWLPLDGKAKKLIIPWGRKSPTVQSVLGPWRSWLYYQPQQWGSSLARKSEGKQTEIKVSFLLCTLMVQI